MEDQHIDVSNTKDAVELQKRNDKIKMQVNIIGFFISLIFGAMFLHNVYCHYACPYDFTLNDSKFNSWSWKSSRYSQLERGRCGTRHTGRMVYDLIDSIEIVGKSKDEIISILGAPDEKYAEIHKEEWNSELCYTVLLNEPHRNNYSIYTYNLCLYFDSTDTTRIALLGYR